MLEALKSSFDGLLHFHSLLVTPETNQIDQKTVELNSKTKHLHTNNSAGLCNNAAGLWFHNDI